ncbi:MAG: LCP family protein [Cryobacterium sp.]
MTSAQLSRGTGTRRSRPSSATNPIRYPDVGSRHTMTKRAWWLVILNIVLPGSAQALAGNRGLGRFGLRATLLLVVLAGVGAAAYALRPELVLGLFTNTAGLWSIAVVLAVYAVIWLVLSLDTLRIARLARIAAGARPMIVVFATAIMVVVSGGAGYGAYVAITASGFLSSVFVAGPPVEPIDGRYNILLLGGDAGADREGLRPDSISVVSIEAATGAATIINLPRNLEDVPFPDDSPLSPIYPEGYGALRGCYVSACMLNSLFTEVELKSPELYPDALAEDSRPGIEAMRDAVRGITGLTLQYYVLIDMQGFSDLIDALGGVDIDVQNRVPVHADESFTTVAFWFEPGMQHMDGYHALWFARSRHGTSDYDRIQPQTQLQEALLAQASPSNVLAKFQGVAQAGSQVVKTDVPQGMLAYFVGLAKKTRDQPITTVPLIPDNGVDPENPDYSQIRQLISDALTPAATSDPAS